VRIRVLNVVIIGLLCGELLCELSITQDAPKSVLHADRVVVLKKQRTLQLISQGKSD
jgi:hypothetical protein